MDVNTSQKQSFADKPFLERLGILLGILASIAAVITIGYFLYDRYHEPAAIGADAEEVSKETQGDDVFANAEVSTTYLSRLGLSNVELSADRFLEIELPKRAEGGERIFLQIALDENGNTITPGSDVWLFAPDILQ